MHYNRFCTAIFFFVYFCEPSDDWRARRLNIILFSSYSFDGALSVCWTTTLMRPGWCCWWRSLHFLLFDRFFFSLLRERTSIVQLFMLDHLNIQREKTIRWCSFEDIICCAPASSEWPSICKLSMICQMNTRYTCDLWARRHSRHCCRHFACAVNTLSQMEGQFSATGSTTALEMWGEWVRKMKCEVSFSILFNLITAIQSWKCVFVSILLDRTVACEEPYAAFAYSP